MKKLMYFGLLLFASLTLMSACGGEDDEADQPSPASPTMFRINEITGIKYPEDPFEMHATGNTIQLHWFAVGDCAGYEIMYALQEKVANDVMAWTHPENIAGRMIVSAHRTDTLLQDLQYNTTYSFAIRVLSDKGEQYHSEWFGTGTDRQWANICQRTTEEEPDTIANEE